MIKCQNCGFENADVMNFCGECGAMLKNAPRMVVPLETIQTENVVESFGTEGETETVVENRHQPSIPTLSIQKPQNNKKIFAIFGGLFALFFIIFAAAGTLLYFYWKLQKQNVVVKPTPTPTLTPKKRTPTPKPSVTPKPSPSETPEETPEKTPESTPEVIFTPPTKPTQKGSFTIDADAQDWQLSELETVPSETFRTSVRGSIYLDEVKENVSPEGVKSGKERRIFKQFPTGALLMRTRFANGKVSNIQPITASEIWENAPDESGRIEFLINDNLPENNEGRFIVTLEMVNNPK